MPNKTIAKFSAFVIFLTASAAFFSSCAFVSTTDAVNEPSSHFGPPKVIANIRSSDITESSGIAASRCQPNVLWTHNDSGDDAFVFALDLKGENLGTWKVSNAENVDWEDIASFKDKNGKCFIYIGEIGDNKHRRAEHIIYRIPEPKVTPEAADTKRKDALTTDNAEILRFTYPDYIQDAETLMVHPSTADIYIATKRVSGPSGIYRLKSDMFGKGLVTAEKIAEISVPAIPNGFVTGGDISPNGRNVIICDYTMAYEWTLSDGDQNFDDIWKQKPEPIDLGPRKAGEAVSYNVDGTIIYATSESKNPPLIEVRRKQ